ncbi:MAG: hypothetical protein K9H25_17045 [Rhodospirillum sp.]|nr:hypothetical protein [Rhodospirillum sp.]MCF8489094.1 hypothetical protein [Rhodospirillum sp.]MCF8498884.1 hypothetical protein [Rhodospirillum sp.]
MTSFISELLERQRREEKGQRIFILHPADPLPWESVLLEDWRNHLARSVDCQNLGDGSPWRVPPPLERDWRRLLEGARVRHGRSLPAFVDRDGLGDLTLDDIQAAGAMGRLPRPLLVALAALPWSGGGRRRALRRLARHRGTRDSLACLDGGHFKSLKARVFTAARTKDPDLAALLADPSTLCVLGLLRPDDPTFAHVALMAEGTTVPFVAIQTGPEDLVGRGVLLNRPRLILLSGPEETANAEAVGVPLKNLIVPQSPTSENGRVSAPVVTDTLSQIRFHHQRRVAKSRGALSHTYGANTILAHYAGLPMDSEIDGIWHHYWSASGHNYHPALVAQFKASQDSDPAAQRDLFERGRETTAFWVARQDQADYLRSEGFKRVEAIGLPAAYLPKVSLPRDPGSLLVMPPHSLPDTEDTRRLRRAYRDYVESLRPAFSRVVAMVAAYDYHRGFWRSEFEAIGVSVLRGAGPADKDSLERLKRILCSFEFMTTNGNGSHIAYGAAFGAKVSIAGPFHALDDYMLDLPLPVKMYPAIRGQLAELLSEGFLRREYPFLFVDPERASSHVAWGQFEIGAGHVLSPEDARRVFRFGGAEGV